MRAKYIEKNWAAKTTIENEVFEGEDFTGVDLNSPIFNNVTFRNCRFEKTKFSDGRLYHCHFESCVFIGVDLRNVTIGAGGGLYKNCTFTKCDFRNGYFYQPAISGCFFDECKFKGTDFKASCFEDCKFKGKLEDVVFHGKYVSDLTQNSSVNTMKILIFQCRHGKRFVLITAIFHLVYRLMVQHSVNYFAPLRIIMIKIICVQILWNNYRHNW
ncbi:pentapeptide repeat-containing protein [Cronobacter dublinensis]|uniref:pentapeptide repeat-containing protein n=1 Tax=Cronobacter dublinensis TaxID=413497 RepID=UPI00300E0449